METKINPKSYIFVKYLFTLSLLLLYLVGFVALAVGIMQKDGDTNKWLVLNYYNLSGSFLGVSVLSLLSYVGCRFYLHKKSTYKLISKEKQKIYINISVLSSAFVLGAFLIFAKSLSVQSFFWCAIIMLVVLIILGVFISVLDELSLAHEKNLVIHAWKLDEQNISKPDTPATIVKNKQDNKNPFMEE